MRQTSDPAQNQPLTTAEKDGSIEALHTQV